MQRSVNAFRIVSLEFCLLACWSAISFAQAGVSANQPCVILKRMGPADEVTSHLYSFGFRGKQFQYEAGKLPESVKFHGRLTDNDVRSIQNAGGRVEVINAHYTDQELATARKSCNLPTDVQSSSPSSASITSAAALTVKSNPDGADITVDGKFAGNTPSRLQLPEGAHSILIEQTGYAAWQRQITISNGNDISITAVLVKTTSN